MVTAMIEQRDDDGLSVTQNDNRHRVEHRFVRWCIYIVVLLVRDRQEMRKRGEEIGRKCIEEAPDVIRIDEMVAIFACPRSSCCIRELRI